MGIKSGIDSIIRLIKVDLNLKVKNEIKKNGNKEMKDVTIGSAL